jgi:hypothetical protein
MIAGRFYEVLKKMPSSRSGAAGHEPMELEVTGGLMADYEKRKRAMDQKKGLGQQQSSEYDDRKKCSGCKKPLEGTAIAYYYNASLAFYKYIFMIGSFGLQIFFHLYRFLSVFINFIMHPRSGRLMLYC